MPSTAFRHQAPRLPSPDPSESAAIFHRSVKDLECLDHLDDVDRPDDLFLDNLQHLCILDNLDRVD